MDIYKEFIENSINPFILFSPEGNILEYNKEGEYLLSIAAKEELFELAINHASMHAGFKHTFLELQIGHSKFCAILVGYIDSETLGLMLYKNMCSTKIQKNSKELQSANIFTLIDIAINTNLEQTKVAAEYDVSIPEFKLDINHFLKTLNKIFKALKNTKELTVKVHIATGRSIKINQKRYRVVEILIESEEVKNLRNLEDEQLIITFENNLLRIELPFIT
ncbi:hypothetical protein [Nitratiruptor sp. YY09-18]|uniref:hypothetical protein n=1 Tax=Nitratiruptor sp. YY09-18 TaxID=2724901 RepID=UPI0019152829|nr:hypothetical protein [Nitratiruptor sp. YY09-18]BCD67203.1 hypothetical protein NitYY0918_C0073 [Nitratiruptor sp. YY09-18]